MGKKTAEDVERELEEFANGAEYVARLRRAAPAGAAGEVGVERACAPSGSIAEQPKPMIGGAALERMICAAKAQGFTVQQISQTFNASEATVVATLDSPRGKKLVVELLTTGGLRARTQFLDNEGLNSLISLTLLRDDAQTPVTSRIKCCQLLADRAWGQPTARVEHSEKPVSEDTNELDREIDRLTKEIARPSGN